MNTWSAFDFQGFHDGHACYHHSWLQVYDFLKDRQMHSRLFLSVYVPPIFSTIQQSPASLFSIWFNYLFSSCHEVVEIRSPLLFNSICPAAHCFCHRDIDKESYYIIFRAAELQLSPTQLESTYHKYLYLELEKFL